MKVRTFFGWPGPIWLFPIVGAAMAAMTLFATRDLSAAAYPTWNSLSTAWHESLWIPGAVVAGSAALISYFQFPSNSPVANALRPRVNATLFIRHGVLLGAWLLIGQFIGFIPAIVSAWRDATGGGFRIQEILMGAAGLTMLAVTGFSIGALVHHWIVGPAVTVFWLVVFALPTYIRPVQLLEPVQQWATSPRFEISIPTAVYNMISSAVLAIAISAIASWLLQRGSVRANAYAAAVWGAAIVLLVLVALVWNQDPYVVDTPVAISCQTVNSVEVCVHSANSAALDGTSTAVVNLQNAGLGSLLERATDVNASERTSPRAGEALLYLSPEKSTVNGVPFTSERQAALSISYDMTLGNCTTEQLSKLAEKQDSTLEAVQRRLLELAGYSDLAQNIYKSDTPEAQSLAAMSSDDLGVFLQSRGDEIRNCRLSEG